MPLDRTTMIIGAVIVIVLCLSSSGALAYFTMGSADPAKEAEAAAALSLAAVPEGGGVQKVASTVPAVAPAPPSNPLACYELTPLLDSEGSDIRRLLDKSPAELAQECDVEPTCKGFNSNGWLKHTLTDKASWVKWTEDGSKGFYTRTCPR